ncbi:MAG: endonuclease III [Defluviitaleaceae bacterium]|nr:endonuclease III [Defluviitaleaceae bacterium]MCL2203793.1 endonuclease III [Defluviitaleaceae bacterium]MCL2239262.1 endonuclease III [Defluviitaleaceae bacterium]
MKSKAAVKRVLAALDRLYPWDGRCFLHYQTPWQLLFATILSAQCTDERVNQVTPVLFAAFPTLEAFAQANLLELEEAVRPTGFFHVKAQNLQRAAQQLLERHNGQLPSDMEALTALPGVGRKTANVVRGHIFGLPSVTVDTHVKRVAYRLGLTSHTDPVKIEFELMGILPKKHWIRINQQLITHGRHICKARRPLCGECTLPDCERHDL